MMAGIRGQSMHWQENKGSGQRQWEQVWCQIGGDRGGIMGTSAAHQISQIQTATRNLPHLGGLSRRATQHSLKGNNLYLQLDVRL